MTTDLPILYSFRRCPYAMRARLALLASRQRVLVHEILLRDKPAALRLASAKATVPVLVLPDGSVLDESLDVMDWALGRLDPEDWLGAIDEALIAANDGGFKHHLDRYKYADRHSTERDEHRTLGLAFLSQLEARLATVSSLCRETTGYTDIAIMPFVRQFAATDRTWFEAQQLPQLQRWLARLEASPLFDAAMLRFRVGQPTPLPDADTVGGGEILRVAGLDVERGVPRVDVA